MEPDEYGSGTRKYLALGELLDVLRPEYPDLTVSKIRFLEQQGLLMPERTPSGYRKFYPGHVERLRWILEQQEGTYLPLREIKTRLQAAEAEGRFPELDVVDLGSEHHEEGNDSSEAELAQYRSAPPAALGERRHPAGLFRTLAAEIGEPAGPPPVEAKPTKPTLRVVARGRDAMHTPITDRIAKSKASPPPESETSTTRPGERLADRPAAKSPAAPAPEGGTAMNDSSIDASRTSSSGTNARANAAEPTAASTASTPSTGLAGSNVTLTFNELVAQSGCSADDIRQLEQFGLIVARTVLGKTYYDENALTAALVAVKMSAFGVEARHLRLYRNAAERESDFFLQVVSPLIYRREDKARQQAAANLNELQQLGAKLREATLRQVLQTSFEPR